MGLRSTAAKLHALLPFSCTRPTPATRSTSSLDNPVHRDRLDAASLSSREERFVWGQWLENASVINECRYFKGEQSVCTVFDVREGLNGSHTAAAVILTNYYCSTFTSFMLGRAVVVAAK